MSDTHDSSNENQDSPKRPERDDGDMLRVGLFFAAMFLILFGMLVLPHLKLLFGMDLSEMAVQPIGSVQRISFISNMGYDTQVDTETRSLLLSGFVEIPRNTPMELRTRGRLTIACASGTTNCWRLLGH